MKFTGTNYNATLDRWLKMTVRKDAHGSDEIAVPEQYLTLDGLKDLEFVDYELGTRVNVQIHVLFSNVNDDPPGADLAFLRYLPNAFVPNHIHVGWEFAYVLSGDYYENDALLPVGTLVLSSPGSEHFMRSEHGCMLLAMRAHPVAQNHDSTTRLRYGLPPGQLDYLKNGKAKTFER